MAYDLYPAVDPTYNFPIEIRQALAKSLELRSLVIPMPTTTRNNLSAAEKWDGRVIANTTTDRLERYDAGSSTWVPQYEKADAEAYVGSAVAGRNRIINGDFSVNQRNWTSGSALNNTWCFDRWMPVCSNTSAANFSAQIANLGELPESAKYYLRCVTTGQTGAGTWAAFRQRIEDVQTLSGKQVTVSFWAKANAAKKIGIELTQFFGLDAGASLEVVVSDTSTVIGTAWARYSVVMSLPSLAGKVIMKFENTYLQLDIHVSAGSGMAGMAPIGPQDGTFDIWGVQLEEGVKATVFERKSPAEQLINCQRYFCFTGEPSALNGQILTTSGISASATIGRTQFQFPVRMRKVPNFSTVGNFLWSDRITSPPATDIRIGLPTAQTQLIADLEVVTSGMTIGRPGLLAGGPGAQIFFNAEL
jgi:hypothetical protein